MAWISIDADTSWQDATVARQCVTAWNDRLAALTVDERTAAGVDFLSELVGEPDEVFDVVFALQSGIEKIATLFSHPTASLTGSASYPANFSSVAAMMTAAGLTQSGYWRRIAEGGTQPSAWTSYTASGWAYGKITDKDLAGPWLWKDIQTALTALKRRIFGIDTDNAAGFRDTATPSQTGSAPSLPAIDYESYGLGTYGQWYGTKIKVYSGGVWTFTNGLIAHHREYSLADLGSAAKTIRLLGKARTVYAKDQNSSLWTLGFGTGLGEVVESVNDLVVVQFSETSTSASTASLTDLPVLSNWSGISSFVPWVNIGSPSDGVTYQNTEALFTYSGCFAVDYAFDP